MTAGVSLSRSQRLRFPSGVVEFSAERFLGIKKNIQKTLTVKLCINFSQIGNLDFLFQPNHSAHESKLY